MARTVVSSRVQRVDGRRARGARVAAFASSARPGRTCFAREAETRSRRSVRGQRRSCRRGAESTPASSSSPPASPPAPPPGMSSLVGQLVLAAGLLVVQDVLLPLVAHANESAPEGTFELILKTTEGLGPLGGAFFVLCVVLCECIPLFPTTPLSLASGILFGPQKGALLILGGTSLAAVIAFSVSRGFGRPIAERIISAEMQSHDEDDGPSLIQEKLQDIEGVIERGSFWQQAGSVLAMRLTPVIPFSASNYLLGLTPLPIAPYLTGTLVGMSFWSVVYASLGGASRAVLRAGVDPDQLLAELLETTGNVTSKAGIAALLGALIVGAVFFGKGIVEDGNDEKDGKDDAGSSVEASEAPLAAAAAAAAASVTEGETAGDPSVASKLHLPAADVGFYGEIENIEQN